MAKHSATAPIESKVYAATVGTGAGAIVSAFVLWLLGVTVWGVAFTANAATDAIAAVPAPISGMVGLLITVAGSFAGGYLGDHTERPDLEKPLQPMEDSNAAGPAPDGGGTLQRGYTLAYNGTGENEYVTPAKPDAPECGH